MIYFSVHFDADDYAPTSAFGVHTVASLVIRMTDAYPTTAPPSCEFSCAALGKDAKANIHKQLQEKYSENSGAFRVSR